MPNLTDVKDMLFSIKTAPIAIMLILGIIFIPLLNMPVSVLQYQFLYLLGGIWLVLLGKKLFKSKLDAVTIPGTWFFALPIILLLLMLASSLFSGAFWYSFFDHGMDNTSAVVFLVLAVTFIASYYLADRKSTHLLFDVMQTVFIINLLVFAVNIWTPVNLTASSSGGILPTIFDFGALSVAVFFVSLFKLTNASGAKKWINLAISVLSLMVLAALNIFANWLALLVLTLVALKLFTTDNKPVKTYLMLFAILLSATFLLFGSQIQRQTLKITGTNFVIVNPSSFASNTILQNSYASSVKNKIIGSGPSTFKNNWDKYKPAGLINPTPYWNASFTYAYSLIVTYFITIGVLGGLLFVLFIAHMYWYLVRLFFAEAKAGAQEVDTIHAKRLTFLSVLFLTLPVYGAPGIFVLFAGMIVSAFALKELVYIGVIRHIKLNQISSNRITKTSALALLVSGAILLVYFANSLAGFTLSQMTYKYLRQGNPDTAMKFAELAQALYIEKDVAATLSGLAIKAKMDTLSVQLNQATQDKDEEKATNLQTELGILLNDMILVAQEAVNFNPLDYRNYITLAAAYSNKYAADKNEDNYTKAAEALNTASGLAPGNPIVPFNMALLALLKEDVQSAQTALGYAINLKPDFDAAYASLTEIALAQKADETALQIAQLAVQNAPNNSNAWLRLGYILYQAEDYQNASLAFERSIATSGRSDVNTLYVLALSYNALQEYDKALNILNNLKQVVKSENIDSLISEIQTQQAKQSAEKEDTTTNENADSQDAGGEG